MNPFLIRQPKKKYLVSENVVSVKTFRAWFIFKPSAEAEARERSSAAQSGLDSGYTPLKYDLSLAAI